MEKQNNNAIKLTLPNHNLINSKFHDESKTRQICVIENTENNREAIRHLNKIAKEQDSEYRFKMRYRKPKPGHKYGWAGNLRKENALGIGLYIEGAVPSNRLAYETKVNRALVVQYRQIIKSQELAIEDANNVADHYKDEVNMLKARCARQDQQRSLLMAELVALKSKIKHMISNIL